MRRGLGKVTLRSIRWDSVGLGALAVAALISVSCLDQDSGDVKPTPDTTSPEAVASRFFHWYVSERNLGRDPMSRASLRTNVDVTPEFINSMEASATIGRDPMVCSAQTPHAFTVGEPELSGAEGRVTVASNDSLAAWEVQLKLQNSIWRVDAIRCAVG